MGAATPEPAARTPGRPRALDADERILDACFAVMSELGYARMSVVDVARRAEVTRPTVYRRWATKEELAVAALERAQAGIVELPDTGDLRGDLVAHLRSLHQTLTRPNGMAIIGTMLAEEFTTPALLAGFREHVVPPRRRHLRAVLARAQQGGRLSPAADLDLLVDLAVGACYARYVSGTRFEGGWADAVAETLIRAAGGDADGTL